MGGCRPAPRGGAGSVHHQAPAGLAALRLVSLKQRLQRRDEPGQEGREGVHPRGPWEIPGGQATGLPAPLCKGPKCAPQLLGVGRAPSRRASRLQLHPATTNSWPSWSATRARARTHRHTDTHARTRTRTHTCTHTWPGARPQPPPAEAPPAWARGWACPPRWLWAAAGAGAGRGSRVALADRCGHWSGLVAAATEAGEQAAEVAPAHGSTFHCSGPCCDICWRCCCWPLAAHCCPPHRRGSLAGVQAAASAATCIDAAGRLTGLGTGVPQWPHTTIG